MSWATNNPIRFHLGSICIWNRLTKRTVDLRDGTLQFLQEAAPALFKDLVEAPRPSAMGDKQ
jgi:hypothetical protein